MSEEVPPEPELPEWLGKAFGLVAIIIVLMAVMAALSVLFPRLLGF